MVVVEAGWVQGKNRTEGVDFKLGEFGCRVQVGMRGRVLHFFCQRLTVVRTCVVDVVISGVRETFR